MSDVTIEMPDGAQFRTQSKKRYVVAVYDTQGQFWRTYFRTDVKDRALACWRGLGRGGWTASVVDKTERVVIR
jgi:hypothetical protein